MSVHVLRAKQVLPISLDEAWDFISSPKNLSKITPPNMGFHIRTNPLPEKMYAGMMITYTVKPILGIPTTWVTEITQVEDKKYFVDEQRVGPYAMWHHEHFLSELNGEILMEDIIHYALPLAPFGDIAHPILVKGQLNKIFSFRYKALIDFFGKPKQSNLYDLSIK